MTDTLTQDKIFLLRQAFKGLDDDELAQVAALTEFRTYPANYILCHEGAYEDVLYIIADGSVVISQKTVEGEQERILREGGRGTVVGEMALIQSAPRAATVRTTSECTVLEMEKQDFETILSRSPRMAIDIIRITLDRIRANDKRMIEDLQKTNKVLRQLDQHADVVQPGPERRHSVDVGLQRGQPGRDSLGVVGVVPEVRSGDLVLQLGHLGAQPVGVDHGLDGRQHLVQRRQRDSKIRSSHDGPVYSESPLVPSRLSRVPPPGNCARVAGVLGVSLQLAHTFG